MQDEKKEEQQKKLQGLHFYLLTRTYDDFKKEEENVNFNAELDIPQTIDENNTEQQIDLENQNQDPENQQQQKKQQKQLAKVPLTFTDYEDYQQTFEGHILTEAKAQITKAIATDSLEPEKVKLEGVEKVKTLVQSQNNLGQFWKFRLKKDDPKIQNPYQQSDFCLISQADADKNEDIGDHFIGLIDNQDGEYIQLRVVYKDKGENQRIRQSWFLKKLCKISTIEREYEALQNIESNSLIKTLLNPKLASSDPSTNEYFSIPDKLQQKLYDNYNDSQLDAIQQTLKKNGITLIQGPPGTGKTTTVIGTVSVLMNSFNKQVTDEEQKQDYCTALKQEDKSLNMKRTMPWMYSDFQDWRDEIFKPEEQDESFRNRPQLFVKEKGIKVQKKQPTVSEPPQKILICGPSNASIDEIIKKLIQKKLMDSDGNEYDPSKVIVRVGDNFDSSLEEYSLDYQANKLMQEKNLKDDKKEYAKSIILKRCKIVTGTLSASGSIALKNQDDHYDTVIIDEAAQAVESSILIPLQYCCKRLILIGDHNQLPATIFSKTCEKYNYSQSLFERLEKNEIPIHMLKVQYRMHPTISKFISTSFYQGNLRDYENIMSLIGQPQYYQSPSVNQPLIFLHVNGAEKFVNNSFKNEQEANCIVELYKELLAKLTDIDVNKSVGIITPYQKQVREIRKKIKEYTATPKCPIEVNSVDGYQGREKDIIIFSTVRASKIAKETMQEDKIHKNPRKTIGFLKDNRRMNVSLSRARIALIVLGDMKQLQYHENWKNIINHSIENNACYKMSNPYSNYFERFQKNSEQFNISDLTGKTQNEQTKKQKKQV